MFYEFPTDEWEKGKYEIFYNFVTDDLNCSRQATG